MPDMTNELLFKLCHYYLIMPISPEEYEAAVKEYRARGIDILSMISPGVDKFFERYADRLDELTELFYVRRRGMETFETISEYLLEVWTAVLESPPAHNNPQLIRDVLRLPFVNVVDGRFYQELEKRTK
jgi:hypothetical protein